MATIPRFQSQVALTGGARQPTARAIPGDFGQARAAALVSLGQTGVGLALNIQKSLQDSDIRGQRNQVRSTLNNARAEDRENMAVFLGTRGVKANNVYNAATEYFSAKRGVLLEDESLSEFQRDMISSSYDSYSQAKLQEILAHQERQRVVTEISTLDGSMANDTEDFVASRNAATIPGKPSEMDNSYTALVRSLETKANLLGWTDEIKEQQRRKLDNVVFAKTAQAYINDGAIEKSKAFIDLAFKDGKLTTATRDKLVTNWETASLQQRTDDETARIIKDTKDQTQWSGEVAKIKDDKLRTSVGRSIAAVRKENDRQKKIQITQTIDIATKAILGAQNFEEARNVYQRYSSTYDYTGSGANVKQLEAYAKSRFGITATSTVKRDHGFEVTIKDRIDLPEGHPDRITNESQIALATAGKTNDPGINSLKTYLKSGGRLGPVGSEQLVPLLNRIGYREFITKKIEGRKAREIDRDALGSVSDYLQNSFAETKGQITSKMITKEMDELASSGYIEGTGFFGFFREELTLAEAAKTGRIDEWSPTPTTEERDKAIKILNVRGEKITDANIKFTVKHDPELYGIPFSNTGTNTGLANK